jgi:hypothetical protein
MPRTSQIAALAIAAAVALPQAAAAQTPAELLAEATPLSDAPVPRDAPSLTDTPIADRDTTILADAGDPEKLLAQAPAATATPPSTSLPRTGPELLLTLLAGGGMVLVGSGLRLRLRATDARVASVTPATAVVGPR